MLASRDMANFVSQEAYERASLAETSVHVINHVLLIAVRDRTRVLFSEDSCVPERFPVGELSHLPKSSSKLLCKACPGCGGTFHIRKVSCSCGHAFVVKNNKHLLTPSRMHTSRSFRAIETVEKAADQLTKLVKSIRNRGGSIRIQVK